MLVYQRVATQFSVSYHIMSCVQVTHTSSEQATVHNKQPDLEPSQLYQPSPTPIIQSPIIFIIIITTTTRIMIVIIIIIIIIIIIFFFIFIFIFITVIITVINIILVMKL